MKLTQNIAPVLDIQLLLDQRIELKARMDQDKGEWDYINANIQAELHKQGVESLIVGDYKVALIAIDGRSSIDRMKLLEAGVTTNQIQAATTTGAGYARLDVRAVKAGKK